MPSCTCLVSSVSSQVGLDICREQNAFSPKQRKPLQCLPSLRDNNSKKAPSLRLPKQSRALAEPPFTFPPPVAPPRAHMPPTTPAPPNIPAQHTPQTVSNSAPNCTEKRNHTYCQQHDLDAFPSPNFKIRRRRAKGKTTSLFPPIPAQQHQPQQTAQPRPGEAYQKSHTQTNSL